MRLAAVRVGGKKGMALAQADGSLRVLLEGEAGFPGNTLQLIEGGPERLRAAERALSSGKAYQVEQVEFLPVIGQPPKIICIGLNYFEHAKEGGFVAPDYPTIFARYATSLIGHNAGLLRPLVSTQFDYEGELVAVIGKGGRRIPKDRALDHVVGYSIFNDGSVRDYQLRTPQWTIGKTFDGTGAFGPYLVTTDELPSGARGLRLQTRLNGQVMQDATTADLIFDIATLVSLLSEAVTLEAGDVIVTGTPAGVGHARKPQVHMKAGDVCEIEIEGVGLLRNTVVDEKA